MSARELNTCKQAQRKDTSRLYQKPGLKATKISMNFEREIGENPCLA
jgi:hypothetical protein